MAKKRWSRLLVLLAVLCAAGVAVAYYPYNEPTYEGKRITTWLDDYAAGKQTDFSTAIHEIGTNAIPFVIRRLAQNDSKPHIKYREYWPKLPTFAQSILPSPRPDMEVVIAANAFYFVGPDGIPQIIAAMHHKSVYVREAAAWSLGTLRRNSPLAEQAIPSLAGVLRNDDDRRVQFYAAISLREMGPAASNAVSVMNSALIKNGAGDSGTNAPLNAALASALGKVGPAALEAAPTLRLMLTETDAYVRGQAAVALWRIQGDTAATIPVLVQEIPKADDTVKWDWITALGEMGPQASNAFPVLEMQLKTSPSAQNRSYLTNALHRIDPEAMGKLSAK